MKYLRIRNWGKHQDIAGKRAQFVKLSTDILLDAEFMCLGDQTRLCFLLLLAYAGHNSNKIPADTDLIKRMCYFDENPDIETLVKRGFLEDWCESKHLEMVDKYKNKLKQTNERVKKHRESKACNADVTPNKRRETETETETETNTKNTLVSKKAADLKILEERFNTAWDAYPEKIGKAAAMRHFKAQVKTDQDFRDLGVAMVNYIQDVAIKRNNGFKDLRWKHGSAFFNKLWRDYVDYKPPVKKTADGIPGQRDMAKDELKAESWKQIEFVDAEVLAGKTDFGEMMAQTWLYMAVGKKIAEYEQRFSEDPLDKRWRDYYDSLKIEYKKQDEMIEGVL